MSAKIELGEKYQTKIVWARACPNSVFLRSFCARANLMHARLQGLPKGPNGVLRGSKGGSTWGQGLAKEGGEAH